MIFGLTSAGLVDAVIGLTLLEGLGLLAWHRTTGRGVAPRDFLLNLLAGLCLMAALRCAVRDTGTVGVALALMAAGAAHLSDLLWRARRKAPGAARPDPAYPDLVYSPDRPTHRSVSP